MAKKRFNLRLEYEVDSKVLFEPELLKKGDKIIRDATWVSRETIWISDEDDVITIYRDKNDDIVKSFYHVLDGGADLVYAWKKVVIRETDKSAKPYIKFLERCKN